MPCEITGFRGTQFEDYCRRRYGSPPEFIGLKPLQDQRKEKETLLLARTFVEDTHARDRFNLSAKRLSRPLWRRAPQFEKRCRIANFTTRIVAGEIKCAARHHLRFPTPDRLNLDSRLNNAFRFVEWAQNEIAIIPDFHKRILFSDEAHFRLNGYVNKQNCRIWSEANPQVYVETPLHPEKQTVWCALWAGGILLQKR
ncbi:hypothetical protein TNCV_3120021 [Trichonephila clavipes]|uniref:Transposase n=1 Tax=Trichonephila clavipes TaxID=2585209 RepID=A0A8X7BHS3_TRICX|nr:hypothetical protein TNCV_3120021 [Trichonephila clavipes]